MRRMYSEKNIVNVVNEAIEEGEIQAGGVSPEQKAILDQMSYNAENDFFVVQTNDFTISDNTESEGALMDFYLDEENGEANINSDYVINLESQAGITANGKQILTIDDKNSIAFNLNNGSQINISDQEYADIFTNHIYDFIVIQNGLLDSYNGIYALTKGNIYQMTFPLEQSSTATTYYLPGMTLKTTVLTTLTSGGAAGSRVLKISTSSRPHPIFDAQFPSYLDSPVAISAFPYTGTVSGMNLASQQQAFKNAVLYVRDNSVTPNDFIILRLGSYNSTNTYLKGESATAIYECVATPTLSNAAVTITKTAK